MKNFRILSLFAVLLCAAREDGDQLLGDETLQITLGDGCDVGIGSILGGRLPGDGDVALTARNAVPAEGVGIGRRLGFGVGQNAAMHAAENRTTLIYNDWADHRVGADIICYTPYR